VSSTSGGPASGRRWPKLTSFSQPATIVVTIHSTSRLATSHYSLLAATVACGSHTMTISTPQLDTNTYEDRVGCNCGFYRARATRPLDPECRDADLVAPVWLQGWSDLHAWMYNQALAEASRLREEANAS